MTAIGIDLGTTNSCVAVYQNGIVEIIANCIGEKTTPSCVAFTNSRQLVGESALMQSVRNAKNTVYGVKRLLGRRFADPLVIEDRETWPFEVLGDNDEPRIAVEYKNERRYFSPENISAIILMEMKTLAENYLCKPVKDAVITVPAYFNNNQREATKRAAEIAGLNLLHIINEPTAASIAYAFDKEVNSELNILVFDLGGGTFDVSIMCIREGVYEVKATSGNTHLGGEDFTNRLVKHSVDQFSKMHEKDITRKIVVMKRIHNACEIAKRSLSIQLEASLELDNIIPDIDFDLAITRECFEEMNADLFSSTLKPIGEALEDAKIHKNQIDEIILVGGSTRIPKVRSLVQEYFNGKILNQSINPDEAVAYGAAVQAAMLSHEESQKVSNIRLLDVAPLSLGIALANDELDIVIKRNTPIPTKQKRKYSTNKDNQCMLSIEVFEGERLLADYRNLLGKFILDGISPAPRGVPDIEVTFCLGLDGTLEVTVVEKGTAKQNNIRIVMEGRSSEKEKRAMVENVERIRTEGEEDRDRIRAKHSLENLAYDIKTILQKHSLEYKSTIEYESILNACCEVISWLGTNQNADIHEFVSREKMLKGKQKLIEKHSDPNGGH